MNKYLNLNKSFINGEWVNGDEGKSVDLVNPYNDDVLAKVELASINQVNEAFTGARNVQKSWGYDSENRKAVMKQAVEYFKNNKEAIMELLTLESGSTQVKAGLELDLTIGIMEEAVDLVDKIGKFDEKESIIPDKMNEYYRLPKGVFSSMAPFNFPIYLSMRTIAPALALGNTVVHKADLQCGLVSGSVIAKAFEEAGLPSGAFQSLLTNSKVIGDIMLNHKEANLVSFTGSTPVGRKIGKLAGEELKDVALELGGNGPFCVMNDADIDNANSFEEAGLPSGAFQSLLTNSKVIGDIMLNHKEANLVSFTGSTPVGRKIGKLAGEELKDVALELGGNGPFCVMNDADIDNAVDAAIYGKYLHQGQICMITNRIIVHEDVYDEFTQKFVERSKQIKYGDPRDPEVVVGPLINKNQVDKSEDNINNAKEAGF